MSDTPRTDEVWGSMHGSGYQMMLLAQKLERELAEREKGYRQGLEAAAKLVDHILKEGGGTYGDAIRALVPPADYCTHDQRPDVGAAGASDET